MLSLVSEIRSLYSGYNSAAFPLVLCIIALIYLLIKDGKDQRSLLVYGLAAFFLLSIPGIGHLVFKVKADSGKVWLVYGVMASVILCGYTVAKIYEKGNTGRSKLGIVIMMGILLQFGIGLDYSGRHFELPANGARISAETEEIADVLAEYCGKRLLAPREVAMEIREYDSEITVLYGSGISYTPEDFDRLMEEMEEYCCDCVVVKNDYDNFEGFTESEYFQVLRTGNYVVYTR